MNTKNLIKHIIYHGSVGWRSTDFTLSDLWASFLWYKDQNDTITQTIKHFHIQILFGFYVHTIKWIILGNQTENTKIQKKQKTKQNLKTWDLIHSTLISSLRGFRGANNRTKEKKSQLAKKHQISWELKPLN